MMRATGPRKRKYETKRAKKKQKEEKEQRKLRSARSRLARRAKLDRSTARTRERISRRTTVAVMVVLVELQVQGGDVLAGHLGGELDAAGVRHGVGRRDHGGGALLGGREGDPRGHGEHAGVVLQHGHVHGRGVGVLHNGGPEIRGVGVRPITRKQKYGPTLRKHLFLWVFLLGSVLVLLVLIFGVLALLPARRSPPRHFVVFDLAPLVLGLVDLVLEVLEVIAEEPAKHRRVNPAHFLLKKKKKK